MGQDINDIQSVQKLYETIKDAKVVKGRWLGREITLSGGQNIALSDVVDRFQKLTKEGKIAESEGVIEEVKYVELCRIKLKELNVPESAIPTPLQLTRKKQVKETKKEFVQSVKQAPHISRKMKLAAGVAKRYYKYFTEANVEGIDRLVAQTKRLIDQPYERTEETLSYLYDHLELGSIHNFMHGYFAIIATEFNALCPEFDPPEFKGLGWALWEVNHRFFPDKPSREVYDLCSWSLPVRPSILIHQCLESLYPPPQIIAGALRETLNPPPSYMFKQIAAQAQAQIAAKDIVEDIEKYKIYKSLVEPYVQTVGGITLAQTEDIISMLMGKPPATDIAAQVETQWHEKVTTIINAHFHCESNEVRKGLLAYFGRTSNELPQALQLTKFQQEMNDSRIDSLLRNELKDLSPQQKYSIENFLKRRPVFDTFVLTEIDQDFLQTIDTFLERFEESCNRRLNIEQGSGLSSQEKASLKEYLLTRTSSFGDENHLEQILSPVDALWEKRTQEIDRQRVSRFITKTFPSLEDLQKNNLVDFMCGTNKELPSVFTVDEQRNGMESLLKALLQDGLPQYISMADRLETALLAAKSAALWDKNLAQIKEAFESNKGIFTEKQEQEITIALQKLAENPEDKATLDTLKQLLARIIGSTTSPQNKLNVLTSLANSIFENKSPILQKLAVQLAGSIPITTLLVDKNTFIQKSSWKDCFLFFGGGYEGSFVQKIYSAPEHFGAFTPRLFSALATWETCHEGYYDMWEEPHQQVFSPEVHRMTENFLFQGMPGLTPFPFQKRLTYALNKYPPGNIPENFKPYLVERSWI